MRICFCDDEPSVHLLLEKMVSDWSQKKKIPCKMVHYSNAQELLFQTEETFDFDCMLLDIQMEGIDGIALAKKIRQSDKSVLIAFLTGVREYAPEGYEVQAARYLLKPVRQEKLFELLDLAAKRSETQTRKSLLIETEGEIKKLYFDEIFAVESQGHFLIYHCKQGQLRQKTSFVKIKPQLDERFVMTHRSFCVNLAHVTGIARADCILDNGEKIPVSRSAYRPLNEAFIRYYKEGEIQ